MVVVMPWSGVKLHPILLSCVAAGEVSFAQNFSEAVVRRGWDDFSEAGECGGHGHAEK